MNNSSTGDDLFISASDFAEPQLSTGALNDLLRQQLNQKFTSDLTVNESVEANLQSDSLSNCIVNSVSEMLNQDELEAASLQPKMQSLFDKLYQIYETACIDPAARKRQFISRHGLVISPDHCVTTQKDMRRVRAFIRGSHQAIADLKDKFSDCLHIVYPACGPFAPLLLPLIAYYKETGLYDENNLRITLIDMQPGAVDSLHAVIHQMGIAGYINEVCCQDACEYQTSSPIHMVVLEAMQHGFSKEGHLPMARHFAKIMEHDGIFLPQEVILQAVLSASQREFIEQWQNSNQVCKAQMQPDIIAQRVELGDILRLTPESLRLLKDRVIDENTRLIECGEVLIPVLEPSMEKPMLLICTHINTYRNEFIGEYDSGITHPLPDMHVCVNFVPHDAKPGDLLVKTGDKMKFYYRLNGLPGFLATLAL